MSRNEKRKAEQKARKAAGKARTTTSGILFIREDNFVLADAELLQSMP